MADEKPTVILQPAQGVISVATGTIDALRTSPVLLVMVLLNCGFLGVAAYYLRNQQLAAYALVTKVLDHCLPDRPPHSGIYPPSSLEKLGQQ